MSVGDFVNITVSDRTFRLHRLVADFTRAPAVENFAFEPLFVYIPHQESRRLGFFRGLFAALLRVTRVSRVFSWIKLQWDSRRKSLIRVMSTAHDVGLQQTPLGVEAIGIPFSHVLMMASRDYRGYGLAIENQLTAQLNRYWENYVDPLVGIRTRMLLSQRTREHELIVFFGDGVFVPRSGERPVGRVEIRVPDHRDAFEPSIAGELPGGLYRGQSALAFSGTEDLTPATTEALGGIPGTFCVRARAHDSTGIAHVLDWVAPSEGGNIFTPINEAVVPLPPGVDGAFRVEFADSSSFEVRIIENIQPGRLHHVPCPGEFCFAIIGIVAPGRSRSFSVERWWVDLDSNGHLVASAMRLPKFSVVCERGKASTWDWSTPHAPSTYPAILQEFETPAGKTSVLLAPAGAPFGWLEPPRRTVRPTFAPSNDAAFGLDWLDFSGAVQNQQYHTERLSSFLHNAGTGGLIPGLSGGEGRETILVRDPGQAVFSHSWRGDFQPGARFLAGPFVLEVADDRGT